jgi:hypothetical protein
VETYTYVNIFETKGLEYLLLISFLVLLLLLIKYLAVPEDQAGNDHAPGPPHRR